MLTIEIPGNSVLNISNIVLDYNGTLAIDGILIDGVSERLNRLARQADVYVVTADTFGNAAENLKTVNCRLTVLSKENQQKQKADFVSKLGSQNVVAIGNGLNDALMLQQAALGVVILQAEGAAVQTWQKADVAFNNINDALDLLLKPKRLQATLRT